MPCPRSLLQALHPCFPLYSGHQPEFQVYRDAFLWFSLQYFFCWPRHPSPSFLHDEPQVIFKDPSLKTQCPRSPFDAFRLEPVSSVFPYFSLFLSELGLNSKDLRTYLKATLQVPEVQAHGMKSSGSEGTESWV